MRTRGVGRGKYGRGLSRRQIGRSFRHRRLASARSGFLEPRRMRKTNALPTWYTHENGDGYAFGQLEEVNNDAIGSCARKISAAVEVHKKETVSQRNAVKANDFHDKNVHETSGGDENSESRKVQRLKRIENLANDPWFMLIAASRRPDTSGRRY